MRSIVEVQSDIDEVKKELKEVENEFGIMSYEYIEVHEEFCGLIDELSFNGLHTI